MLKEMGKLIKMEIKNKINLLVLKIKKRRKKLTN